MATTITTDCISCGACEPECPNNAISQGDPIYVIDPKLCTECVGFHDYEACAAVCPVDCCVTDPQNIEPEDVLIARARQLHHETDFGENYPSRFRKGSAPAAPAEVQRADVAVSKPVASPSEPEVSGAAKENAEPALATSVSAGPAPGVYSAEAKAEPASVPPAAQSAPPSSAAASTVTEPRPIPAVTAKAPVAQTAVKPGAAATTKQKTKKTFAKELPVTFEEISKRYTSGGSLNRGFGKALIIFAQPLLGALPHEMKKRLEAAVQTPLFTAAGSTGLNIIQNAVLYPLICMAVAVLLQGPAIIFSQDINSYILFGFLIAAIEAIYRLKDGIFSARPADDIIFHASIYGAALGLALQPLLEKHTRLIRDLPIPVDGFYGPGFVGKLERERRYGNVYTMEDRGGALLLRMEFPRFVPDTGFTGNSPKEMPEYDYDLALQNGQFVIKGRCSDEQVRKISSSIGAFPPEFTTVIPLRERITGFAHRFENKVLEVFLMKDSGESWSKSYH